MEGVLCFMLALLIHSSDSGTAKYKSNGCKFGELTSSESVQAAGTSKSYTMTTEAGDERVYIVYLPSIYNPTTRRDYPVIFALPGFLTSAQEFETGLNINGHADDNKYIIVYAQGNELLRGNNASIFNWNDLSSSRSPGPNGPICDTDNLNRPIAVVQAICPDADGGSCAWTNCLSDDIAFIDELADLIEDEFCIDTSREYVMGFSNGGMMTQRLACEMNDRFAAAVPMHGQLHLGDNCQPKGTRAMPIMNIHGSNDQILPGRTVESRSGWYFMPVSQVQNDFAIHNGCDRSNGQQPYPTAADGTLPGNRTWACTAFSDGCEDAPTVQCEQTWGHDWPIRRNGPDAGENWAQETIWEFLSEFQNRYKD